MRLTPKIVLILSIVLIFQGILSVRFFLQVIEPSFIEIENKAAVNNLERVVNTIQDELIHLTNLNHDWAAWDVTYDFMQSHSEEYIEENLPVSSFTDNFLNIIHFYDVTGKLIWGEARDLETEELFQFKDFSGDRLAVDHPILNFKLDESPLSEVDIKGVWMSEHGPILISSRPILNNTNQGPYRGTLIMGRLLSSDMVENLNNRTKVEFNVFNIGSDSFPQSLQNVLTHLKQNSQYYIDKFSDVQMESFTLFPDIEGQPALLIQTNEEREIFAKSRTVMKYAFLSIIISILIVIVVLSFLIFKVVVSPVASLSEHINSIGTSSDLTAKLEVRNRDEVGLLTEEFNSMIAKLHEAKHKLQEQSFQMGMAELASGTMHNLRNSLGLIVNSLEKIHKTIGKIPVVKIKMAREELGEGTQGEERKQDLIEFLDVTNKDLLEFVSRTEIQLNTITPHIEQSEGILKGYEKWAYSEKIDEKIQLDRVINESILFMKKEYHDKISFHVEPAIKNVGYVHANRIMLIQVVLSLLNNAAESITLEQIDHGEIRIDAESKQFGGDKAVHFKICDNGPGIHKDILPHIFNRGFSTKEERGNTGMGLHWCFNAVQSMNGKLYADNNESSQGACFHLFLPVNTIHKSS